MTAISSVAGITVTAALLVAGPVVLPATAQAACDQYRFKGGLLQLELDNGATVQIPAGDKSVGPGQAMYAIIGRTSATFGKARGGINGRHVDVTVDWDQDPGGGLVKFFTGDVNDEGRASGVARNATASFVTGWHTNDTLSCADTAPPPAPKVPPPSPPPPPPPPPPPEPPKDAVQVDIQQTPFNVTVNVTNTSSLPGKCTYDAKPTNNPLSPPVHRNFDLGPNGNTSLSFLALPLGTTYHVVVSCKGTFNGKSVEFGHVEQDVTGSI